MSTQANQNRRQFINWLRKNEPLIYKVAARRQELKSANGLGEVKAAGTSWSDTISNIFETVGTVGPSIIQTKQQYDLIKMQMERAKKGLPPADVSSVSPTITVRTDISPESEASITRIAQESLKSGIGTFGPWLIGGAALVGALIFLKR